MSTSLETYMRETGIDDAAFGEKIGKDRTTVSRLRRGLISPSLNVAASIEAVTGGAVPMKSWIESEDGDQRPFMKRATA